MTKIDEANLTEQQNQSDPAVLAIRQILEVCRKNTQALKELQGYTFALHDKLVDVQNRVIALELHAHHQDDVRASAPVGGALRPGDKS